MIKNYVKYTDEINNEYINSLKVYDSKLNILTHINGKNEVKSISKDGRWPSRFKYVKNLYDLNAVLSPEESLIIEIGFEDLDKIEQKNLFQVRFPEKEDKQKIGAKTYLVDWEFSFKGLPKEIEREFEPVVALKDMEQTPDSLEVYQIKSVHTIMNDIDERRHDLKEGFGGISNLYYRTQNPNIAEQFADDVIEFTQVAPGKWIPTSVPRYMMDNYSK